MKRIPIYICILALLFLAPVERSDVGKLLPVEAVSLDKVQNMVILTTDTGDTGQGDTVSEALQNLKETTPALVYLDTARYLLITEAALAELDGIRPHLKESVRICLWNGEEDLADAAKYLTVHGNLPKLKQVKTEDDLPFYTNRKISRKNGK